MLKGNMWIKLGSSVAFSATLCCMVLVFQVLFQDNILKAGIATFSFNLTDIRKPINVLLRPHILRGFIPEKSQAQSAVNIVATAVPGIAQSAANAATTAIPGIISDVQSAANSAATAIPDLNTIKELIPKKFSVGTKQFCIEFDSHTDCNNLPLNISSIVPEAAASFMGDQVQALQSLAHIMTEVTPSRIQACFISGLVLLPVIAAVFVFSVFSHLLCFTNCLLRLGIGLICCIPFLVSAVILCTAQSKIQNLGSIIKVEKGCIGDYSLGALFCTILIILVATFTPVFI